ncbi:TPA: hypothetical protein ON570_004945 [Citrobacter werkmanii]|nr:hypothetical protein [Citrobacter werkmanii]
MERTIWQFARVNSGDPQSEGSETAEGFVKKMTRNYIGTIPNPDGDTGTSLMSQKDQLNGMIADIKHVIQKNAGVTADTTVTLEKTEETGRIQITICIKNISEMKIAFRELP